MRLEKQRNYHQSRLNQKCTQFSANNWSSTFTKPSLWARHNITWEARERKKGQWSGQSRLRGPTHPPCCFPCWLGVNEIRRKIQFCGYLRSYGPLPQGPAPASSSSLAHLRAETRFWGGAGTVCFTTSLILPYYPPFLQPKYLIAASIVLSGFALVPKLILMRSPLSSFAHFPLGSVSRS